MVRPSSTRQNASSGRRWSLLSSHGVVLLSLARRSASTVREISDELQMTERHVVRILRDLADAHMIDVHKMGSRNTYRIRGKTHLRHPTVADARVEDLLELLTARTRVAGSRTRGVAASARGPRRK
jgi:DNA-binding transcriptional ArsR family regulator